MWAAVSLGYIRSCHGVYDSLTEFTFGYYSHLDILFVFFSHFFTFFDFWCITTISLLDYFGFDIRHSFYTQHIQHASLRSPRRNIPAGAAIPGRLPHTSDWHDVQVHFIHHLLQRNAAEYPHWDDQRGKFNIYLSPWGSVNESRPVSQ